MPDSTDLIVNIYIGQPIVKNHTADGLASSIAEQILKNSIDPAQIEGFSGDGQYIKWKVHDILKEKANLSDTFVASWDPLHRSGVVDTDIRKDPTFSWLIDVQQTCKNFYSNSTGVRTINFLLKCAIP